MYRDVYSAVGAEWKDWLWEAKRSTSSGWCNKAVMPFTLMKKQYSSQRVCKLKVSRGEWSTCTLLYVSLFDEKSINFVSGWFTWGCILTPAADSDSLPSGRVGVYRLLHLDNISNVVLKKCGSCHFGSQFYVFYIRRQPYGCWADHCFTVIPSY